MNHHEIQKNIPAFCLGALDGQASGELKQHLNEGCFICEQAFKEMQEVVCDLA